MSTHSQGELACRSTSSLKRMNATFNPLCWSVGPLFGQSVGRHFLAFTGAVCKVTATAQMLELTYFITARPARTGLEWPCIWP